MEQTVQGNSIEEVYAALEARNRLAIINTAMSVDRAQNLLDRERKHYWRKEVRKGNMTKKQNRLMSRLGVIRRTLHNFEEYSKQVSSALAQALGKTEQVDG